MLSHYKFWLWWYFILHRISSQMINTFQIIWVVSFAIFHLQLTGLGNTQRIFLIFCCHTDNFHIQGIFTIFGVTHMWVYLTCINIFIRMLVCLPLHIHHAQMPISYLCTLYPNFSKKNSKAQAYRTSTKCW